MPKRRTDSPESATTITTYAELEEILKAFARDGIRLLIVLGRPGLAKGKTLQKVMREPIRRNSVLYIKGRKSAIDFYIDCYRHKDRPIVLDDADVLLADLLCRSYVKDLTETDQFSRLDYGTQTTLLEKAAVPRIFWTTSPVCIIANHWDSTEPIFQALESRGEFIHFDPAWPEVYRQASSWFWDQEIYDYLYGRLGDLREPDVRVLVKAYARKKAGMKKLPWKAVIDEQCDDEIGMNVRGLLDDPDFANNSERVEAFCEITGADRATFYRRKQRIETYRPKKKVRRIVLKHTEPPNEERPSDGSAVTG